MTFTGETCGDRKKEATMQADSIKAAVAIADILLPWAPEEQIKILHMAKDLLPRHTDWIVMDEETLKVVMCKR